MDRYSLHLFNVGVITLVIAFVFHIAHTTVLARVASARRVTGGVRVGQARLAGAGSSGGGTTTITLGSGGGPGGGRNPAAEGTGLVARLAGLGADESAQASLTRGIGVAFTWGSLLAVALSMLLRGIIVGRGPWGNMYEFSIAFGFGIVASYLYLGRRYPIRTIGFLPLGVALFLFGYAMTLSSTIEPLVPALQSPAILTVHVAMAMISYGIFAVSFGAGVGYLVQGPTDRVSWLPSHKVLDEVGYRAVIIGFPIFATLIILGSWWASVAWGRYWGWDPKETAALVTWLIYAVYLHARNQRGWAGRPSALILVIGFVAVLFTYFGNLYFSGLHAYSGL
jgi:cytochrome c-type biogenesis protein CcsB